MLVAFDIDGNGISISELPIRDVGDKRLYSIKRVASSANQNGQVTTYDIEDDLLIIAFVFVDFSAFCIEVGEDRS